MTPDQIVEAGKLINTRKAAKAKLDDIDGRLRKLGVDLSELDKPKPADDGAKK